MNRFGQWALIVAIVVLFNAFVNYGINIFYPHPSYSSFVYECSEDSPEECRIKGSHEYSKARDLHERNISVFLSGLGVFLIIGGLLLKNTPVTGYAFLWSGVVSLVIGSARYWSALDDVGRFVTTGAWLLLLIGLSVYFFKNKNK